MVTRDRINIARKKLGIINR